MNTSLRNRSIGLIALLSLTGIAVAQSLEQEPPPPAGGAPRAQVRPPRPELVMLKGVAGTWLDAGQFSYKVVSTVSGLKDYKQKYNQSGKVLHPGFKPDRLAVIELEIKNGRQGPAAPPFFGAAMIDSDGIRGVDWWMDSRQEGFVKGPYGPYHDATRPAEIGPGQTMKIAVVFSLSPKAKPVTLEFSPENFRDMPFGRGGAPRPGVGAPGMGPGAGMRPAAPPRATVRVSIDLTK